MPEHDDDQMDRVFRDAYAVLMERAPTAPRLEDITAMVMAPSRVTSLLGGAHQEGDSDRGNQSLDQTVEADEQRGARSPVHVLWEDVERPAPSGAGRWPGVAIAVAAAILVVVGAFVVADGNDGDVVTEPASSPVEADPVPLPSVADPEPLPEVSDSGSRPSVADSVEYRWWQVPRDDAVFGGSNTAMLGVTDGGPGFVAVGVGSGDAAVWTSIDGITWSRLPHDEALFGGLGEQLMTAVTVGGPGLVAVGHDRRGACCADEPGSAVVWTSVDGITWSRLPHDEAVFGAASMQDVTVGGPGLVAVGHDGGLNSWDNSTRQAPLVWTSVDGITWSRAPDQVAFGGSNTAMLSVTEGGPGLVAVGFDHGTVAPVWTSVDGVSWSRVADDEAFANGTMKSVTAGGPGLVAAGWEGWSGGLDAAIWTSVDGITWKRVPHDEKIFGAGRIRDVSAAASGVVAVGSRDESAAIWTSVDGITWFSFPDDEAVFDLEELESVTVGGPGTMAVGAGAVIVAEPVVTPEN